MKKLSSLLFAVVMLFVACNGDEPNGPSIFTDGQEDVSGGSIIATFKCIDAADENISHEGYIIKTVDNDTVLTFQLDNVNALNALSVPSGVTVINPAITIPYAFVYRVLEPEDDQYVHWMGTIEFLSGEQLPTPVGQIKQVVIIPDLAQAITKEQLLGTWSEPLHVKGMVGSLTFQENDTLVYTTQPDKTFDVVVTEAPRSVLLKYEVKDNKLWVSGECTKYPFDGPRYTEPFTYSTVCFIKGEELTIYSFSEDSETIISPFVLYKQ